jgi:hypothetical protein
MRNYARFLFLIVLVPMLFAGSDSIAKELLGQTPEGSFYILDKMWITVKPGVPHLATGEFSQGIALSGVEGIDELNRQHLVTRIEPFYGGKLKPGPLKDLVERMYIFTVSSGEDIFEVISQYNLSPEVDFIDPYYIHKIDYVPNDPSINSQWHLGKVSCYDAWDFYFGDATKVGKIAIVDSGVNWYHNDLEDNMWINEPEDINHTGRVEPESAYYGGDLDYDDQDGNGYEDDVLGFDVYGIDADPDDLTSPYHGTHVAGCASEVTDNYIGGAGTGFSARIVAVRAGDGEYIYRGYQGITYAAAAGADLINCSWGSNNYSYSDQQTITAVYLQGCQVVAAAGNDGGQLEHYPAAYDHVIAVASTSQSDHKSSFSNYGTWVDVCAPGESIYSTKPGNAYQSMGGTSMSSPIACGVASLIIAQDSSRGPDDIELLLKAGCDNIDGLNPGYAGKLGAGRVNAYKTIGGDNLPRLMVAEFVLSEIIGDGIGDDDGVLNPGEDGEIVVTIENTGADATNVWAYLYGDTALMEIPDSSSDFGDIPRDGRADNSADPYHICVKPGAPTEEVKMTLNITTDPDWSFIRTFEMMISLYQANWPITLPSYLESTPVIYDIDGDHQYEIVVGCYDDSLYALELDGSYCSGWPVAMGGDVHRAAAIGDIDGDQAAEIVAVDKNGNLYAFEANGSPLSGFPLALDGQSYCAPSLADFDHDDDLEIVVTTLAGSVYLVDGDGNIVSGWPQSARIGFYSSAAVGDLDGDGDNEIVCGALDSTLYAFEANGSYMSGNWPVTLNDKIYSSPAMGDVDGDGDYEVAAATEGGGVYLLENNGDMAFGPVSAGGGSIQSHMTIANLDGTPQLEIIVGSKDDSVYVFSYDGSRYPGWPQSASGWTTCNPAVCDLDGDGVQDIITVDSRAAIYAWDKDGQLLPQMPIDLGMMTINSSPSIFDMDRDGDMEIVVALRQSSDNVAVVDYKLPTTMRRFQWVTFGHDERHTHDYGYTYTSIGEETVSELPSEYDLAQNYPNPFNPATTVEFALPVAGRVSLKVYNLMGQEVVTLANGEMPAGYHQVYWGGEDNRGEPVSSGVYFYRLETSEFGKTRSMLLLK